jgi:Ca2+-binding EF-hand superfamily protein
MTSTTSPATPAASDVCRRIRTALQNDGRTVDDLFNALAASGGGDIVLWADFATMFAALEPTLTQQQLEGLWRTFDKNGDGGVSREEFQRGLAATVEVQAGMAPASGAASRDADVCTRIQKVLQEQNKSMDDLFDALAKDGQYVQWPEFATMFAELEPTLTALQLQGLWQSFDKNGDGGVSRDEFRQGLAPPVVSEESVLSRVQDILKRRGNTAFDLFNSLAVGAPAITWAAVSTARTGAPSGLKRAMITAPEPVPVATALSVQGIFQLGLWVVL